MLERTTVPVEDRNDAGDARVHTPADVLMQTAGLLEARALTVLDDALLEVRGDVQLRSVTVADRAGHADEVLTLRQYSHALEAQRKRAAIPLDDLLGPKSVPSV